MDKPTLYVIAGPNGIGKTTSTYDLVPKTIQVINSDEIAKQVKLAGIAPNVNTQEYSNREASKLIQENLEKRISFGIETNLADLETWKFLIGVKKLDYTVNLIFLSTDSLNILNNRIEERAKRGEHFVTSAVVAERYINGLKLLNHYFDIPDSIQLIDNSEVPHKVFQQEGGRIEMLSDRLPVWVKEHLAERLLPEKEHTKDAKNMSTKEDVLKLYQNMSNKKE
jgi:predicted ABC-type ATPase